MDVKVKEIRKVFAMIPGRQLDRELANLLFSNKTVIELAGGTMFCLKDNVSGMKTVLPEYSTDANAALSLALLFPSYGIDKNFPRENVYRAYASKEISTGYFKRFGYVSRISPIDALVKACVCAKYEIVVEDEIYRAV